MQQSLIEYHPATESHRRQSVDLQNDRKLQRDAYDRPRSRNQAVHRSSHAQKTAMGLLEHMPASYLPGREDDVQYWRRRIANIRSIRSPIVLLQEIMRQQDSESNGSSEVPSLLPTQKEMNNILKHPALAFHDRAALDFYIYILRGRDDDERCRRYLERTTSTPLFIFKFLIRPSSNFSDTSTLLAMIESFHSYYDGVERAKVNARMKSRDKCPAQKGQSDKNLKMDRANFNLIMRLLVGHCLRLEARFIVKLADIASQYIQHMTTPADESRKLYLTQCDLFNRCLQIFRPQPHIQAVQQSIPNVYFWEAQRILLTMSAGLVKPLLISRDGFRAIRHVLSGQPKNYTEAHSSARHAPSWPPYLQPGHGMDELSDPEDNWSRTVSAGMLMQEAGFSKDEMDDAVDILQGVALDGTPTIHQRSVIGKGRIIGVWEASIRATRNAHEAWQRFKNPPEAGMKPGIHQYAAMFEKLVLREVEIDSRTLPGDKALNFSTQHEANLAEFERARLHPPSVSELYQTMKLAGIAPEGSCLRILVANAESLETAHQYLRDSHKKNKANISLTSDVPDPSSLMVVPLKLFAAYIQVCLRVEGRRGTNQLTRAIRLTEVKLSDVRSRWTTFIWGLILKNLSQHNRALRISFTEQLDLMTHVADTIENCSGLQLSSFTQFNKCVRKATRRLVNKLFASDFDSENEEQRGFLQALYCQTCHAVQDNKLRSRSDSTANESSQDDIPRIAATTALLQKASSKMKSMFWTLAERERVAQRHLGPYQVTPLERLSSRRDAIRSNHAQEYMLTLGYLGQFDEMARLLEWLIQEWGQCDVVSALSELDEPPPYADFFEMLCVFRLVAEPMLGNGIVASLLQKMADTRLNWTWPDDEAVKTYADLHSDESIGTLRRAVELARDWNKSTAASATVNMQTQGLASWSRGGSLNHGGTTRAGSTFRANWRKSMTDFAVRSDDKAVTGQQKSRLTVCQA